MAITLDSTNYSVFQNRYSHPQRKLVTEERTATGDIDRVESGVFENRYTMTLICTLSELVTLKASYGKCGLSGAGLNRLDFADEEGNEWNPDSSGTGTLNTGVYFNGEIKPEPMSGVGWNTGNRFLVSIELIVNAKGISS